MNVTVDPDRCASTGSCARVCPEVFELGDDGNLHVRSASPPEALRDRVAAAAELCPTGAITVAG